MGCSDSKEPHVVEPVLQRRSEDQRLEAAGKSTTGAESAPTDTTTEPSKEADKPDVDHLKGPPDPAGSTVSSPLFPPPPSGTNDGTSNEKKEQLETSAPVSDGTSSQSTSSRRRRKLTDEQKMELYEKLHEIGSGHFAKVYECRNRKTLKRYAMKVIEIKNFKRHIQTIKSEVQILKKVSGHPNVVSLIDYWLHRDHFYLVMELCTGGDLFSAIDDSEGNFSERQAAEYCRQLASALKWIHQCGVTHRDLKPENVLLTDKGDIKVADFGLSKLIKTNRTMSTVCGTWAYCAPEVIQRRPYTPMVDNWTLGVLMFIVLCGYHPFDEYGDKAEPQLVRSIVSGKFSFDDEAWDVISDAPKKLIQGLLVKKPDKRLSLGDFLRHPWVSGEAFRKKQNPESKSNLKTQDNIVSDRFSKFRTMVVVKLVASRWKALTQSKRGKLILEKIKDTEKRS